MRKINKIIIHCSDSDVLTHDNIKTITEWHWKRGFTDIGYHAFIDKKGELHEGRKDEVVGAHCKGQNANSLGVCLSGKNEFTEEQLKTLEIYLIEKTSRYDLSRDDIFPHNEFDKGKTCPNFDVNEWLEKLEWS